MCSIRIALERFTFFGWGEQSQWTWKLLPSNNLNSQAPIFKILLTGASPLRLNAGFVGETVAARAALPKFILSAKLGLPIEYYRCTYWEKRKNIKPENSERGVVAKQGRRGFSSSRDIQTGANEYIRPRMRPHMCPYGRLGNSKICDLERNSNEIE